MPYCFICRCSTGTRLPCKIYCHFPFHIRYSEYIHF
nr:MAG TPA: hypothetical protein [Caudoviricetes sp.]